MLLLAWITSLLVVKFGSTFSLRQTSIILLATAPLIYFPLGVALYRQEPLAHYGIMISHSGRALGLAMLLAVVVLPPFILGLHLYGRLLFHPAPPGLGQVLAAWFKWLLQTPQAGLHLLQVFIWQLCFVALPEELFYRGYLQGRLNILFPGRCRLFGADVGIALPLSAGVFALHHFLLLPVPQRLLVFVPALFFGWLLEATGSLLAPSLFHTLCNLVAVLLTKAPVFGEVALMSAS